MCDNFSDESIDKNLFTDGSTDLNFPYGDFNRTQLSIAARKSPFPSINSIDYNDSLIEWLIDKGADWQPLDKLGRDAAFWAIGSFPGQNPHPILHFLKIPSFNINKEYTVTNMNNEDYFQQDVEYFFPNYGEQKITLLIAAILVTWKSTFQYPQAQYNLIKLLLDHNANRNLAPNGITPLQIAQKVGDPEIVKILKEYNEIQ